MIDRKLHKIALAEMHIVIKISEIFKFHKKEGKPNVVFLATGTTEGTGGVFSQ